MIGISKLYCGSVEPSDVLRYGRRSKDLPSHLLQFSEDKKAVVVWNCTRRCNLKCVHCYSKSDSEHSSSELTTDEGKRLIDSLAEFGSPVILFSGGEPLMRTDLCELVHHATKQKMRAVVSTNGTLITPEHARAFKDAGISYVGVSLDGAQAVNDQFRGVQGAFDQAMTGIENCREAGIKVGLRFTITRRNYEEIPAIFQILRTRNIPRVCFYHLVYSGRGSNLVEEDLEHQQTRRVVDQIIDQTAQMHQEGFPAEVLTVDNHADGVYLYLRLLKENPERAAQTLQLLQYNGGNGSGHSIGCVSWDGSVHPDQFWRHLVLGNVRERDFADIWTDTSNELLMKIKRKKEHVTGRCGKCRWLDICGGNFRVRAEALTGDLWAPDPACYLTDEEIGLA